MSSTSSGSAEDPSLGAVAGDIPSAARAAQEQYLEALRTSQQAFLDAMRTWSQSTQTLLGGGAPARGQGVAAQSPEGLPELEQVVDNVFGFAEELLTVQREFTRRMLRAARTGAGDAGGQAASGG
jgi:hypothetical protein